jgi:AcrR family transcriptional regulator
MTDAALACDGRVLGARAQRTRRKLLDATALLLEERGAFGLRVVDITRAVDMSPATFYHYFPDVEAAILVLAREASDTAQALAQVLEASWHEADGEAQALAFVRAFIAYWDAHRAVLRVRDLRAEEGDARFWAVRLNGYSAILPGLQAMLEKGQASGRVSSELNAYAAASALVAMLERLVTYRSQFGRRGVGADAMSATLATILYQTVTGYTS